LQNSNIFKGKNLNSGYKRFFLLLLFFPSILSAQELIGRANIDAVKAAFIFNFIKFIEWPSADPVEPAFKICVMGNASIEKELTVLVENNSGGKKVTVQHTADPDCRVVFVNRSSFNQYEQYLSMLAKAPALTISDYTPFISKGGIIEFYLDKNNLKFDINNLAAKDHGLIIRSRLLQLAKANPSGKETPK
jgi:hypothetical protein